MQRKRNKVKKIVVIQIIFIIVLAMILNMTVLTKNVQAITQTKRTGIDAFPEDYKEDLRRLQQLHPNWSFTAFYTDLNWQGFMNGECSPITKNTIQTTNKLYIANGGYDTGGGFYPAAPSVIAHYADPRNFLTEERNIPIYGDVIQFFST